MSKPCNLIINLHRRFKPSEIASYPSLHVSIQRDPKMLCSVKERELRLRLQDHCPFCAMSPIFCQQGFKGEVVVI